MQFSTFNDLLQFRSNCFCGAHLVPQFSYNVVNNATFFLRPAEAYSYQIKNLIFSFILDVKEHPFSQINFVISLPSNSNNFIITLLDNDLNNKEEKLQLIIKYLNNDFVELKLNIKCSGNCPSIYQCKTKSIEFNFKENKINPLSIEHESFTILNNEGNFFFKINYKENLATVSTIGKTFSFPANKFAHYPLKNEIFNDKIKILLTYC